MSEAGGLGLIGGASGDTLWLQTEIAKTAAARVGYGFITWSLAQRPEVLGLTLARPRPAEIMLSFGDIRQLACRVNSAGAPLISQVQTVEQESK